MNNDYELTSDEESFSFNYKQQRKPKPVIFSSSEDEHDSDEEVLNDSDLIEDSFEEICPTNSRKPINANEVQIQGQDSSQDDSCNANDVCSKQNSWLKNGDKNEQNCSQKENNTDNSINKDNKNSLDNFDDIINNSDDSNSENKKSEDSLNLGDQDGDNLTEEENSLKSKLSSDEEVDATESFMKYSQQHVVDNDLPLTTTAAVTQPSVKKVDYEEQVRKVAQIEEELKKTKVAKRVIKLENLPDKGKSLLEKEMFLEKKLEEQKILLNNMEVINEGPIKLENKVDIPWDEIAAGVDAVAPRTFGKKGVERFKEEKVMAVETLDELHRSLATCPTENDLMEDPKGLKVPLMPHQQRALAWLLWRENQKPSGGLLADDMGLGKTLTMISLVIKSLELESDQEDNKESYRDKYPGGTLVVCPASLINQWSGEIESKTKRGLLSFEVYHGAKRETKPKRLAKHDIVITTYAIVLNENEKNGTVFGVRWRRIILDEAHQIRNHKARTSEAIYRLSGKSRWALTGTPVHNKELDMYSLLKFLRCSPFDNLQVWKHWVSDKSTGGQMRLHAVVSSLMLRRTKEELMSKGVLQSLPQRTWELISISLEKDEMAVYQKVLIFSRTLFAQFLHQRAEKRQDEIDFRFNGAPPDPNGEYLKMRNKLLRLNKVKEVSQHHILVLLLRLRQICCHPSLITQMLQGDEDLGNADDEEESEEMNLLEQLSRLDINDEADCAEGLSTEAVGLKEASKGFLNPSNPVFSKERPSAKVKALVKLLKAKIKDGDKAIVVSQWTSLLQLIAIHLKEERVIYDSLDGSIPVNKRMAIVDNFNKPSSDTRVLLLSLTAGGVGLNLIGANHLFLMDLHWNPQLENQAQDRIYRMGQNKPIFVYKLMATDTIEERIKCLQEKKLEIANSMLTGSKKVINSKLTLQDLKLLFDFK